MGAAVVESSEAVLLSLEGLEFRRALEGVAGHRLEVRAGGRGGDGWALPGG